MTGKELLQQLQALSEEELACQVSLDGCDCVEGLGAVQPPDKAEAAGGLRGEIFLVRNDHI